MRARQLLDELNAEYKLQTQGRPDEAWGAFIGPWQDRVRALGDNPMTGALLHLGAEYTRDMTGYYERDIKGAQQVVEQILRGRGL